MLSKQIKILNQFVAQALKVVFDLQVSSAALFRLAVLNVRQRCSMGGPDGSTKFPTFGGSAGMAGRGSDAVCMRADALGT